MRFLFALVAVSMLSAQVQQVEIDDAAPSSPFPHFWEQMFGSGRAILSLRESYRDDLRAVKEITGFRYVRFHAIFQDEVGVYNEDEHGNPVFNFAYVDEIYDGLLKNGVRPVVEIGFMPKKLAFNPDALHPFWYKQNVSPPKSWEKWDALLVHFARHLVERYGIDEVAQWYFEVWNEPNIDFWNGIPRQKSYFELYDHTARDLKSVSSRLRVGGPATAAAAWVSDFLKHAAQTGAPVDFVSTHGYADDTVEDLFGTREEISMDDRVCRAAAKVKQEIRNSPQPELPLFWTEWNVPGMHEARDTSYVGPAVANTIRQCDGLIDMLSFWTFSDVFEEGGPIPQPFEGHFGLRAKGGINKPSFYDFALLHKLGGQRIRSPASNVLVTRRKDGALVIAVWNLATLAQDVRLQFRHIPDHTSAMVSRVDADHGNTLAVYRAMGSPQYPTEDQVKKMNAATAITADRQSLESNRLDLKIPANGLTLVELEGR